MRTGLLWFIKYTTGEAWSGVVCGSLNTLLVRFGVVLS